MSTATRTRRPEIGRKDNGLLMTPAEFDAYIKAEISKWRKVIENGHIPKI